MASVRFEHASIDVGGTRVLTDVSLDVADGDFLGVIGPSGSGKSTLLRAVAGFADVVVGRLTIDGEDMAGVRVARRDVGMVLQQPVLFPHRSVERNVAFPLELRHQAREEIRRRVGAEVRAMHVEHLLGRRPSSLSRGEAQLVQIARTMVRTPRVLLLDEPLANLDDALRRRVRAELRMLQEGYAVTTLVATNDPEDAMHLPQRLAVLHDGRVVQVGSAAEVSRAPATLDAAVATGECSLLPVTVVADRDGFWLERVGRGGSFRHRVWAPALKPWAGTEVTLMIRPDDVIVSATGSIDARAVRRVPGQPSTLICEVAGRNVGLHDHDADVQPGDPLRLRLDHAVVFDPAAGTAIAST
ncbi:MAG: ABC transporter ATP-binding protein [Ilumatobacter sp.]|nr:ABC transporter ATP-binding protein [Ilumatobacter sp.]